MKFSATTDNGNASEVTNGSLVTFKCEADGNPSPVITIESHEKQCPTDINGTFQTLMTCRDGGVFFCKATPGISPSKTELLNITVYAICEYFSA